MGMTKLVTPAIASRPRSFTRRVMRGNVVLGRVEGEEFAMLLTTFRMPTLSRSPKSFARR